MSKFGLLLLAGASLGALAAPAAYAQPAAQPEVQSLTEVVVTARRREESLQEVPATVDVVTSAEMEKLNLRSFNEIQAVVPGLTLQGGGSGFSSSATVRGISFSNEASGNNQTVEFYLNDAPISANFVMQSMFDVGQFELLRGPQGTLRGRASPSGSITVTSRRPAMSGYGGTVNVTSASSNAFKGDFAVNVPLVPDVLAVRLAGVYDENEGNGVRSIKEGNGFTPGPRNETRGFRASVRAEPTDWASINLMYQSLSVDSVAFGQVQSATFVTGAPIARVPLIDPYDRLAITDTGSRSGTDQEVYVANIELRAAGQKLNYVGAYSTQDFYSLSEQDAADFFAPPRFPLAARTFVDPAGAEPVCQEQGRRAGLTPSTGSYFQCVHGDSMRESHEIRLSSDQPIAGMFNYVIGAMLDRNVPKSRLTQETPIILGGANVLVQRTPIIRNARTTEKSIFGNLTARIGEKLELSGGLRYIDFSSFSDLIQGSGRPIPAQHNDYTKTIYSGSAKYRVTEDLMVYGLVGTSWRPGAFAVGDFNLRPTARERSFFDIPPETSTSYEIGLKTVFMENRGQFNLSVFRQEFENYVFRGPSVYFVDYRLQSGVVTPSVGNFNFIAAVPATVQGFEADAAFQIQPRWSISANVAFADGEIENGTVACTDLNGDGRRDVNAPQPTLAQLQAAVGPGENISACSFSGPTLFGAKWSASLQSEKGFSLADNLDGFLRGLVTYRPDSEGDPANTLDDVDAYALVNLYAGLRAPTGAWEISFFAKNIFNTKRVTSVGGSPISATIRGATGNTSFVSDYHSVSTLPPREVGINLRYAFGTR